MRGTDAFPQSATLTGGIIPACAGNRVVLSAAHPSERDHPRVCGEQTVLLSVTEITKGSSPRVRGTGRTQNKRVVIWDHPRVCGEQS